MDLLQLFSAKEQIGGLEITSGRLSYLLFSFKDEKISVSRQGTVPLETGIIKNGELKNKGKFALALDNLRKAIKPALRANQELSVIVCLPASSAYHTQILSIPNLPERQAAEAIKLVAAISLPVPVARAYYDWQEVKIAESTQKKEILFALAKKEKINSYLDALIEKKFAVRAVEFPALAFSRFVVNFEKTAGLLVDLTEDEGLNISVIDRGELRLDYFAGFPEAALAADEKKFTEFLIKKTREVSEYFAVENQIPFLKSAVFLPGPFKIKMEKAAADAGFSVEAIKSRIAVSETFLEKFGAGVGAALRGLMPRDEDTIITLTPVGTEESHQQKRMASFLKVIRVVSYTVAVFSAVALVGIWVFFRIVLSGVDDQILQRSGIPITPDVARLEEEAKKFNEQVAAMAQINGQISKQTDVFKLIGFLAIPGITLTNISFTKSVELPVNIYGIAESRDTLIEFKKKLEAMEELTDVKMPLSYFQQKTNIVFTISFIKKQQ